MRLTVFSSMLTLAAACATPANQAPAALGGKQWQLVELEGQAALRSQTPRDAHLVFEADSGRVAGSTGCNRLSGTFTSNGDSLRFGPMITTKMACVDTLVMRQEARFVGALEGTRRFQVAGDTLLLVGASRPLARLVGAAP